METRLLGIGTAALLPCDGELPLPEHHPLANPGLLLQVSVDDQLRAHRAGVRRLVQLAVPSPLSYVQEHLTHAEKLSLAASPYRSTAALIDDALRAVIDAELDARALELGSGAISGPSSGRRGQTSIT